jgi:hypothetical protein
MRRVFLLPGGGAVAVELDLRIGELDVRPGALGEGRASQSSARQAPPGARPGVPVLAMSLRGERGHHQRVEVVGDVVERVALVEIEQVEPSARRLAATCLR